MNTLSNINSQLIDIQNHRIKYKNKDECTLLTIQEYLKIAEIVIKKNCYGNVRNQLLQSDDALSFTAYHMMICDWRFNPDKYPGMSREMYRYWCGKRFVRTYFRNNVSKKNTKCISIFDSEKDICIAHTISEKNKIVKNDPLRTIEIAEASKKVEFILNNSRLTNRQKQVCTLHFLYEMSFADIARKISIEENRTISRMAIEQSVLAGINKMKVLTGNKG